MMTPEQRYLFDVTGYLHIENAVSGEALKAAQAAADAYINAVPLKTCPPDLTPAANTCRTVSPSQGLWKHSRCCQQHGLSSKS